MTSLTDFQTVAKYLQRINAEPRSLLSAVVKQETGDGYWIDLAVIKFTKQGEVTAPEAYQPTEDEAQRIKIEMSGHAWPETVFIDPNDHNLPEAAKNAVWFRDPKGNILMGQVRGETKQGRKIYWPITKWSDGEYRWCEPEGPLPLFGLETIKDNTTAIIHEGVKGAKICQSLPASHPWAQELANAAHLGWIGGAINPSRTDWLALQRAGITRAYIVADNDGPGKSAVPKIAQELNCVTMAIEFSEQFPKGFDLGDDFPETMFRTIGDTRYYIGPSFRDCVVPATWMTNLATFVDDKGKPKQVPVLRHHARDLWLYLDDVELFVNRENPDIVRKKEALDSMLVPFSHSRKTSELVLQSYSGRAPKMLFRPDLPKGIIVSNGERGLNTYIPPSIKPQAGDITPFFEFMEYLVPDARERDEVLRWVATVIARPDIRPMFGLLMISEQTGTGKSSLGEKIIAPLVGLHNTAFPSEKQIVDSDFNSWLSQKRLAIIHEIYAGHSFKAANRLKSIITDRYVEINKKYMPEMRMENFICVYACSNSLNALKLETTDRRWFVVSVAEKTWGAKTFDAFFAWLDSGGLSIIAHWAHSFDNYLRVGEIAPMSARKREMIEDGRSDALNDAIDLATALNTINEPCCVGYRGVKEWLKSRSTVYDSDVEIQKTMKAQGVTFSKNRVHVMRANQKIGLNRAAMDEIFGMDEKEAIDTAVKWLKMPGEIMNNGEL